MTLLQAILFGLVEGITEFLPISSTAHLIITSHILDLPQSEFLKTFEIVIQLGAILAIVWVYRARLIASRKTWLKILAAFFPTALVGYLLYGFIKSFLLASNPIIAAALIIGGIVLVLMELDQEEREDSQQEIENISYKKSFGIGVAQAVAVIPGVSRAAATIIASRIAGLSRKASVEFSFLLAIPTIAAASGYDLLKTNILFSTQESLLLLIGLISSFFFALTAVKWLLNFISQHNFREFGYYRIVIGLLFLVFFAL